MESKRFPPMRMGDLRIVFGGQASHLSRSWPESIICDARMGKTQLSDAMEVSCSARESNKELVLINPENLKTNSQNDGYWATALFLVLDSRKAPITVMTNSGDFLCALAKKLDRSFLDEERLLFVGTDMPLCGYTEMGYPILPFHQLNANWQAVYDKDYSDFVRVCGGRSVQSV